MRRNDAVRRFVLWNDDNNNDQSHSKLTTPFHFTTQATKLVLTSIAFSLLLLVAPLLSTPVIANAASHHVTSLPLQSSSFAIAKTTATPTTSAATTNNNNKNVNLDDSMLEEVWNLINKYYLDPTFNGQDWNQVHDKYRQQLLLSSQPSFSSSSSKDGVMDTTTTTTSDLEFQLTSNMVKSLQDKYSRMIDASAYAAIQKYDLIGVGVTLMPNPMTKQIQVGAPPVPHSAADVAGLQLGDYVDAVNGIPTLGRTAFDIIDQITSSEPSSSGSSTTTTTATARTSSDTTTSSSSSSTIPTTATTPSSNSNNNKRMVTMTIRRPAAASGEQDLVFDVTMERQFQKVNNPIKYKLTETRKAIARDDHDDSATTPTTTTPATTTTATTTKVGWIRISEFNSLVKIQLEQALQELHHQGANAYVLDVRHNTGGAFQSAVEIASLFLQPHQVATYVVDRNQAKMPFMTPPTTTTSSMTSATTTSKQQGDDDHDDSKQPLIAPTDPLVIWTDGSSASASEVLAGALRDNCRAVVMGDTSFGKGLIQAVYGLKNGNGLVLTVARYVTPKGYDIQGVGITPDIPGHVPTFSVLNALGIGDSDDTSQVDFDEVSQRLSMCTPPSSSTTESSSSSSSL
jgi:C-terminal processing protease CtpA/Prc